MSVLRQKQRVAYAYLVEQRRCVQEWTQRLRDASGKVQFVIQKSKFDETLAALWTALETEVDAINHIWIPMKAAKMFVQRRWLLAAPDVDARRCPKATARQVICPPAHLESTSARCTMKALQRHQPLDPCNMPRDILENVQWAWIIQVADSAASNQLYFDHVEHCAAGNVLQLRCRCDAHQWHICPASVVAQFKILGDMYCAVALLHIASTYIALLRALPGVVRRRMRIVKDRLPRPEDSEANRAMLRVTLWGDLPQSDVSPQKLRIGEELLDLWNVPWSSGELVHICQKGCCSSVEETEAKLTRALSKVLFSFRPPTPASNRWLC